MAYQISNLEANFIKNNSRLINSHFPIRHATSETNAKIYFLFGHTLPVNTQTHKLHKNSKISRNFLDFIRKAFKFQ